ncbi:hypothetical protein LRP88_13260 [Fusarium phalaenopsidis]
MEPTEKAATKTRKRKATTSAATPKVDCETDDAASDEGEEEGDGGIKTNFRSSKDSSTIVEGDWMAVDVNVEVAMDK